MESLETLLAWPHSVHERTDLQPLLGEQIAIAPMAANDKINLFMVCFHIKFQRPSASGTSPLQDHAIKVNPLTSCQPAGFTETDTRSSIDILGESQKTGKGKRMAKFGSDDGIGLLEKVI